METIGIIDQKVEPEIHLPAAVSEPGTQREQIGGSGSLVVKTPKPRSRKLLLLIAGAAVLLGAGVWAFFHGQDEMEYRTEQIARGNIEATVSATGSPNAVVTVQVGSQVSGNIAALYADFNTKVKKDQLVARIDPAVFESRVNQAQATLDAAKAAVVNAQAGVAKAHAQVSSAEAALTTAKANVLKAQVAVDDGKVKYNRRLPLAQQGVISPDDLDTAKATYDSATAALDASVADQRAAEDNINAAKAELDVATTQLDSSKAQVKQAQAALAQAQLDLDHTYIKAPVDGVVVSRNVDVGQTVAASLQAPTLFLIAQDLTKMQVDTNVSEADVGRVTLNQPATFTVDAYPNQTFHGQVWQIRQAPINVQNVITYDVVIAVSNQDLKLFPGMTANVKILTDHRDNVLKVPNAALRFRPPETAHNQAAPQSGASGGRRAASPPTVWVLAANGKLTSVPVQIGLTDGTDTEVTSGNLKQGDAVVTAAFPKSGENSGSPLTSGSPGSRGPRF